MKPFAGLSEGALELDLGVGLQLSVGQPGITRIGNAAASSEGFRRHRLEVSGKKIFRVRERVPRLGFTFRAVGPHHLVSQNNQNTELVGDPPQLLKLTSILGLDKDPMERGHSLFDPLSDDLCSRDRVPLPLCRLTGPLSKFYAQPPER